MARKGDLTVSDGRGTTTLAQGQETTRDEEPAKDKNKKRKQAGGGSAPAAAGGVLAAIKTSPTTETALLVYSFTNTETCGSLGMLFWRSWPSIFAIVNTDDSKYPTSGIELFLLDLTLLWPLRSSAPLDVDLNLVPGPSPSPDASEGVSA